MDRPRIVINPDLLSDGPTRRESLPPGVFWDDEEMPAGRTVLFQVNGKVYTVPTVVDPRIAFRFMRALKRSASQELAMAEMLHDILGEGIIDTLADDEDLSAEELDQVMKAVTKYAMSAVQRSGLGN